MQALIQSFELIGWLLLALIVIAIYIGIAVRPPGQLKVDDPSESSRREASSREREN